MDYFSDTILNVLLAKGSELAIESIKSRPITLEKLERFYRAIETKKPVRELINGKFAIEGDQGLKLLIEKNYEEAVSFYKVKAKSNPAEPEGWFGVSACLFLTGDWKKCSLYYKKCLEADPDFDIYSRLLFLSDGITDDLYCLASGLLELGLFTEVRKFLGYFKALADR